MLRLVCQGYDKGLSRTNGSLKMQQKDTPAVRMHFQGAVAVVQKHGSPYRMGHLAAKIIASFACWTSYATPSSLLVPFSTLVWGSSLYSSSAEDSADVLESRLSSLYPAIVRPVPAVHASLQKGQGNDNSPTEVETYPTPTNSPPSCFQYHPRNVQPLSPVARATPRCRTKS